MSLWKRRGELMQNDKFMIVNIRDNFQENGASLERENKLIETISTFSCPQNQNVEKFLKEQAIEFTKKNQSVTYLVFSKDDAKLVGYFTLASKPIEIKSNIFSNTMQKKIARVSEFNQNRHVFHLSAYLIAQFGKNFKEGANNKITGQELMKIARNKIKELQYMLGGMVAFLETEVNEKLLEFYTYKNDFKKFDTRISNSMEQNQLVQMLVTL